MQVRATIKRNGEVITEVVAREEHLCSHVYNVTNGLGRQVSDEETGPECDTAQEVQSE